MDDVFFYQGVRNLRKINQEIRVFVVTEVNQAENKICYHSHSGKFLLVLAETITFAMTSNSSRNLRKKGL